MKLVSAALRPAYLLLAITVIPSVAHADIITSSLGLPVADTAVIQNTGFTGFAEAQVFKTNGQFWDLTSIVARVGESTITDTSGIFAELRSHDEGADAPNAGAAGVVATFTIPALPSNGLADITFTPTSTVTLNPGTKYWFVLGENTASADDSYEWAFAPVTGPIVGPGGILGRYAETLDSGLSWEGITDTPYLMQVNGTALTAAAPEPSALALLTAIGGPTAGLLIRRRRSAR